MSAAKIYLEVPEMSIAELFALPCQRLPLEQHIAGKNTRQEEGSRPVEDRPDHPDGRAHKAPHTSLEEGEHIIPDPRPVHALDRC